MPKKRNNIDSELEKNVLAIAMNDRNAIPEIADILEPRHFGIAAHAKLFELILALHRAGINPGLVELYEAVSRRGLEKIISLETLTEISSLYISSVNVVYDSRLVYEYWVRREAKKKFEKAARKIDDAEELFGFLEQLQENLKELSIPQSADEDGAKPIAAELDEYFKEIEQERESGVELGLRSEVFPTFNKTEGIRKGNLMAISGKYKSGKTTFAVALALDFAMQNKAVGIVSLEMSKRAEVYPKLVSMATGTRYGYLRNPSQRANDGHLRYSDERFRETIEKARTLENKKIFVADKTFSASKIERLVRRWVARQGVEVVFIDYIGLVDVPRRERRDLEIAAFSRKMKLLAKELEIVIVLISQENDAGETAESKGLARDADFWFRVTKPRNEGEKTIKMKKDGFEFKIEVDNSLFKVTLKEARHVESGWSFLCYLQRNGRFVEYDFTRADEYQLKAEPF